MNDTCNNAGLAHCFSTIAGDELHNRPRCPMGEIFPRFGAGRKLGWLVLLPGVLLVFIGVTILAVPQVLVWLTGGLAVIFGLVMFSAALIMRHTISGGIKS